MPNRQCRFYAIRKSKVNTTRVTITTIFFIFKRMNAHLPCPVHHPCPWTVNRRLAPAEACLEVPCPPSRDLPAGDACPSLPCPCASPVLPYLGHNKKRVVKTTERQWTIEGGAAAAAVCPIKPQKGVARSWYSYFLRRQTPGAYHVTQTSQRNPCARHRRTDDTIDSKKSRQ